MLNGQAISGDTQTLGVSQPGLISFEAMALPCLDAAYRLARRLTRNEHEAEDLVQETYLKAHKAFSRFELRSVGIKPWLMKVLYNTFLKQCAKKRHTPISVDSEILSQAQAPTMAGTASADDNRRIDYDRMDQEIKWRIDALNVDLRAVLLLWATAEFQYDEIAEVLSVPIGTVMSRLHRARKQLRGSLAKYAADNRIGISADALGDTANPSASGDLTTREPLRRCG